MFSFLYGDDPPSTLGDLNERSLPLVTLVFLASESFISIFEKLDEFSDLFLEPLLSCGSIVLYYLLTFKGC